MGEVKVGSDCYQLILDVVYNEGVLYLFDSNGNAVKKVNLDNVELILDDCSSADIVQSNTWVYVFDTKVASVYADRVLSYDSDIYEMSGGVVKTFESYRNLVNAQRLVSDVVVLSGSFNSVSVIIENIKDTTFRLSSLSSFIKVIRARNVYLSNLEVDNILCNCLSKCNRLVL